MKYSLYSGAGNTFALLEEPISSQQATLLCAVCQVDGVIFPEQTFRMRIFNRDGSEAEMCGNGLRTFVQFLIDQNIKRDIYKIETLAGTHTAWLEGKQIYVKFPSPTDMRWDLSLEGLTVHYLNTGVPHAVIFVDAVDHIDLEELGPKIRYHPLFPKGTNVDIVQLSPLRLRTYERGVEKETLACGTGAVASALAVSKLYNFPSPIEVSVQSGDQLKISFTDDWKSVTMTGPVVRFGEGTFPF